MHVAAAIAAAAAPAASGQDWRAQSRVAGAWEAGKDQGGDQQGKVCRQQGAAGLAAVRARGVQELLGRQQKLQPLQRGEPPITKPVHMQPCWVQTKSGRGYGCLGTYPQGSGVGV